MRMTEKQKKFCDYYIECGNAKDSAIKAGYSAKTAKVIGNENLNKSYMKKYINDKLKSKDNKRIASQNEVLEFYTRVLRGEEKDILVTFDKKGKPVENKVNVRIAERIKCAEAFAKLYGLNVEKVNITGQVKVEMTPEERQRRIEELKKKL